MPDDQIGNTFFVWQWKNPDAVLVAHFCNHHRITFLRKLVSIISNHWEQVRACLMFMSHSSSFSKGCSHQADHLHCIQNIHSWLPVRIWSGFTLWSWQSSWGQHHWGQSISIIQPPPGAMSCPDRRGPLAPSALAGWTSLEPGGGQLINSGAWV